MQRIVCHSSQTDWRSHYGDLVKAKGRLPRIYNEAGYIDIHNGGDSVSYHYWMTDHLGSVHAVVDANNGVEQAHDYTVSGVPATRLGPTVDHHLHTGKPWQGFNGQGWYDNRARVLDALTGRFTTPDPLAERHPDQSPYAHCANNPVRYVDPTGRVLEYPSSPSNMSFNYKMRDVRAYIGTEIKDIEEKLRNSPHHFVVYDANREGGGNRIRTILKLFRK